MIPDSRQLPALPDKSLPCHIAIIMDGNGRWAKERGFTRTRGHKAGCDAVDRVVESSLDAGIPWLTLYAFSTENWNRPRLEVQALMIFLKSFLKKRQPLMMEKNIRLHVIGDIQKLPERCRRQLAETMEATKENTALNLVLALSYGSRDEITRAVKIIAEAAANGELKSGDISHQTIADHLYTASMPDPDLLIRTSGEMRLSNFLLWQLSYAELVIVSKYWPDFDKSDFFSAIAEYSRRHRRFGAL